MQPYKGEKAFILADTLGYITVLKRKGEFMTRFFSGSKTLKGLAKMGT
jgi:hypothetical protein